MSRATRSAAVLLLALSVSAVSFAADEATAGSDGLTPELTPELTHTAAVRSATASPAHLRELADNRYLDGDLEAAVRLYREVARRSTEAADRSEALVNAAWLQFLLGRPDEAVGSLHGALGSDPDLEFDVRNYSPEFERVYLRARVLTARETAGDPNAYPPVYFQPVATDGGPRETYQRGLELIEAGDSDGALRTLQRALALTYASEGSDLELRRLALLRTGLLYYERGQWTDAASAFGEAVGLERSDADAWKNLGLARLRAGELREAIVAFSEAYALEPGRLDNARNLTQALVRAERWDDAVSWILDAVRHHERDGYLHLQLGVAQEGRGEHGRASAAWRTAMDTDRSLDWSYGLQAAQRLAMAHFEQGRFSESAEIAQLALARDPADARFWNLLGLAQQATGDAGAAGQSFLRACDADDGRAEYRNNLGRAYAAVGDLIRAEEAFVHALTLEPSLPTAQANLAQVRKLRTSD